MKKLSNPKRRTAHTMRCRASANAAKTPAQRTAQPHGLQKMRKYDPFQKDEKFFKKVLDNFAASGIITIVPGAAVQEHNRICGYGGIGRRVRFRF